MDKDRNRSRWERKSHYRAERKGKWKGKHENPAPKDEREEENHGEVISRQELGQTTLRDGGASAQANQEVKETNL